MPKINFDNVTVNLCVEIMRVRLTITFTNVDPLE